MIRNVNSRGKYPNVCATKTRSPIPARSTENALHPGPEGQQGNFGRGESDRPLQRGVPAGHQTLYSPLIPNAHRCVEGQNF